MKREERVEKLIESLERSMTNYQVLVDSGVQNDIVVQRAEAITDCVNRLKQLVGLSTTEQREAIVQLAKDMDDASFLVAGKDGWQPGQPATWRSIAYKRLSGQVSGLLLRLREV